jgi:DNA polymerase-1
MAVLLLKLLREHTPKGLCFARDRSEPTFRHLQYAGYKAQRAPLPDALKSQLALLDRFLEALSAPVFSVSGFEADDVIATLARELADAGEQVCVLSGDRDLFQVITERVQVLFIGRRGQPPLLYDEAAVVRRFQLQPSQLPSYVALIGDSADNLEGVSGVGEKTAQRLIARFGSIDALYAGLDQVKPEAVREALREARARVTQNAALTPLHTDLQLPAGPRYQPFTAAPKAALRALFEELEFQSLLPRLDRL